MKATLRNTPRNGGEPVTPEAVTEMMRDWLHVVAHVTEQDMKGHFWARSVGSYDKATWFGDLVQRAAGLEHRGKLRVGLHPAGNERLDSTLEYDLVLERGQDDVIADLQRRVIALERGRAPDFFPGYVPDHWPSHLSPPYRRSFTLRERPDLEPWPSQAHHLHWSGDRGAQHSMRPTLVEELLSDFRRVELRISHARPLSQGDGQLTWMMFLDQGPFFEQLLDRIRSWDDQRTGPFRVAVIGHPMPRAPQASDESLVFYVNLPERQ